MDFFTQSSASISLKQKVFQLVRILIFIDFEMPT